MKILNTILLAIIAATALAQPLGLMSQHSSQQLEPLLSFAEAVEKAKAGNPQGYYALAVHYAKGEEIDLDIEKARHLMQKASEIGYSNAAFVAAMLLEANSTTASDCGGLRHTPCLAPRINDYLGRTHFPIWSGRPSLSITNESDAASIRAQYLRAIDLGVAVATNELARFERRIENAKENARKCQQAETRKAANAKLAEELQLPFRRSSPESAPAPASHRP